MRHRLYHKKLNRTSEHRKSLIKNMLNSLIKYEQITTTLPKARVLKPQIDKVITLGKKDNLTNKRNLFSKLQDKVNAKKVISVLSKRYLSRRVDFIYKPQFIYVKSIFVNTRLMEMPVFLIFYITFYRCILLSI